MAKLGSRFVATIILSSLLVAGTIGIVVALRGDLRQAMMAGTLAGLGWGALMAITIVPIHLLATRKLTCEQCQPEQSREFEVVGSLSHVIGLLSKALSDLPFVRSIVVNTENGIISARTRMSWASFGEEIIIRAKAVEGGKALVTIGSSPFAKFTAIDYGKNFRNVEAVSTKLGESAAGVTQLSHP